MVGEELTNSGHINTIESGKEPRRYSNSMSRPDRRLNKQNTCDPVSMIYVGWLVVLGFNATLTAKVISWRSVTHMCFLAFSHLY